MADHACVLFDKLPLQLRLPGSRGGRTYGCNKSARRALLPLSPAVPRLLTAPVQSAARAVAALDARSSWLRCAEKQHSMKLPPAQKKGDGA
jgi:hypothetical protein